MKEKVLMPKDMILWQKNIDSSLEDGYTSFSASEEQDMDDAHKQKNIDSDLEDSYTSFCDSEEQDTGMTPIRCSMNCFSFLHSLTGFVASRSWMNLLFKSLQRPISDPMKLLNQLLLLYGSLIAALRRKKNMGSIIHHFPTSCCCSMIGLSTLSSSSPPADFPPSGLRLFYRSVHILDILSLHRRLRSFLIEFSSSTSSSKEAWCRHNHFPDEFLQ